MRATAIENWALITKLSKDDCVIAYSKNGSLLASDIGQTYIRKVAHNCVNNNYIVH